MLAVDETSMIGAIDRERAFKSVAEHLNEMINSCGDVENWPKVLASQLVRAVCISRVRDVHRGNRTWKLHLALRERVAQL